VIRRCEFIRTGCHYHYRARIARHGGSNSGLPFAKPVDVISFTRILAEKRRRIARRRRDVQGCPRMLYIAFVTHSVVTFLL
jgi:hypothetical protein